MTRAHLRLALAIAALAIIAVGCSGSASTPAASAAGTDVTITAKDLKFGQSSVDVPAGRAFTIGFDNQEAAPHNVAIAPDDTFSSFLFTGDIVSSQKVTYNVPALDAGTYAFRCDLHTNMVGTIVAK